MDWKTEGALANLTLAGDPADRREWMRLDLDVSLVARPTKNRSRVIQGRIIDISCGGIRAAIAAALQVGDVLELEFNLPYTSVLVRPEAVVRYRTHYQYGLEFALLVAADQEKIEQACAVLALLQ
jgi:c-di-GMP-binding flagellar brake protein YcgR